MNLLKKISITDCYTAALASVAILQTLFPKQIALGFIFLFIVTLIGVFKKQIIWKSNPVNWLFIALYLVYLGGSYFTLFPSIAKSYLEYKLSFILLPIIFSFRPSFTIFWRIPVLSYLVSLVVVSFLGILKVVKCLPHADLTECIQLFSYIHHPTYFAMYLMLGMALMVYGFRSKWKGFNRFTLIVFLVFASLMTAFTLSLSALLSFALLAGAISWFIVYKKYGLKMAISSLMLLFLILIIFVLSTNLKYDFYYTFESISTYLSNPEAFLQNANRYLIGNEVRLIMWTTTTILIMQNPFGVGTGNVDFYLSEKLESYGLNSLAEFNYNPHNQFLQTFLEIGIIGILVFVLLLFFIIRSAIKNRNWVLLILVLSLAFNSLFESILQRQSGIVFFTFWACALLYLPPIIKKND